MIGEERPWRISGEVAALPNDARETVSSGLPESTSGCVDLTHIGRGLALRQGQPQGFASFLRSALTTECGVDGGKILIILVERKPDSQ